MKTVIGIDFGTQSARAILADTADGKVLASHTVEYKHGVPEDSLVEIEDYDSIENEYIIPEYPNFNYLRYLSIFGGDKTELPNRKIMLYLNADGLIIINKDLPKDILKRFKKIRRG